MELQGTTYIIRFLHNDGSVEEIERNTKDEAVEYIGLFGKSDADIYYCAMLLSYEWATGTEKLIRIKYFN